MAKRLRSLLLEVELCVLACKQNSHISGHSCLDDKCPSLRIVVNIVVLQVDHCIFCEYKTEFIALFIEIPTTVR